VSARRARLALAVTAVVLVAAAVLVVAHLRDDATAPVAAGTCADDVAAATAPDDDRLVWHDDFDGDRVDRSRWTVRDGTSLSFDQARIEDDNVWVADGLLHIEARRERLRDRDYTTGYLDTIGHFSQQYGRWEIRAKLPTVPGRSQGLWPAFWLRADDLLGEIDVMEAWGDPTSRGDDLTSSYAWTVHKDTTKRSSREKLHGWGRSDEPLSDSFHVFAVDWTPHCLTFTLDGRVTGALEVADTAWLTTALAGPVNIRLNMQVGSSYWGLVDPATTALPATFLVDSVRVYAPDS